MRHYQPGHVQCFQHKKFKLVEKNFLKRETSYKEKIKSCSFCGLTFVFYYQKDSQKTYKYLARIQNNISCSNKVPIHESNVVITSDRGIANTFSCSFSWAQKKGTYARKRSKIVKGKYKTLKQKNGSAKPTETEDIFDSQISDWELQEAIKQLKNRKSPGED